MLGVTHHIFNKLNDLWGNNSAIKWAQGQSIVGAQYRGGGFEGNQCKQLLGKAGQLADNLPPELQNYALARELFNSVMKSCFSETLDPNYKKAVFNFEKACRKLGIPLSQKFTVYLYPSLNSVKKKFGARTLL